MKTNVGMLKIGDSVIYKDGFERVLSKVTGINYEKETVSFIDGDGFEWSDQFKDIETVIVRILNKSA